MHCVSINKIPLLLEGVPGGRGSDIYIIPLETFHEMFLQITYKCNHPLSACLHLLKIPQLVACADEVVLWVADFIVGIAVKVVCEEAHGLHHGEQGHSERQMFALNRREETCC